MNKILKRICYALSVCMLAFAGVSCDDDAEELTSVEYDRLFAPANIEIRIQDRTGIRASWACLSSADAQSYTIELFENDPGMACEGEPSNVYEGITGSPYSISGLKGEMIYSFRIKAVGETKESNWTVTTFQTDAEQIFEAVADEDIEAFAVTLRWPAGETADLITITPTEEGSTANTVTYTVTAEDIANGYARIEGLTAETSYEAVMTEGERTRGTVSFTTLIDTGGMTIIEEGEDLAAAIDADNGEGIFLMGGTFELGEYELTKSIAIAALPTNKPIIHGRFKITGPVERMALTNLIFDGQGEQSNMMEMDGSNGIASLTMESCEIRNMTNHLIYGNNGVSGDFVINNCIWDNIAGGGGDGFDFRGGSLNSLTITNTTFSNGVRTFLRCQATLTGFITIQNCTFYNICSNTNSNNHGLFRITDGDNARFTVSHCIFYGIGYEGATGNAGVWARSGSNMEVSSETYEYNYWFNSPNLWGEGSRYTEDTGVATEADPGFVDAANGDFTITHEDMIYYQVGDPRWY